MPHTTITKFDIDTCQTAMAFFKSRRVALFALQDKAQLTGQEFETRLAEIDSQLRFYGQRLTEAAGSPKVKTAVHHG